MTFRLLYQSFLRWLYCPQCWQYLQLKVIKFKSGFILLQLGEGRNSGRGTRAGSCEHYRVTAISIYTLFKFGWLMLQKQPRMVASFSNEKEILQNLHLTKKEVALKVCAGEWTIHTKSWCHILPLFCLRVQLHYHSANSVNSKNVSSFLDLQKRLNMSMCKWYTC